MNIVDEGEKQINIYRNITTWPSYTIFYLLMCNSKSHKKTKGLQKVNYVCFSFYSFFPDLELGFYCTVYERIGALEHNKLRTSYVLLVYI